ncbi:MAG TPA: non-heme iron oxygenase ferredoxin subunit [Thermomicrobiales bacterium]|nr:non-heme iron oxygenase ferredoxin subunit [Thermomicrobiales bacterium]
MSDFQTVARTDEIEPGEMRQVRVGRKRIAIVNVGGEFFAIDDTCTHEEASLSEGELYDDIVECPLHGAAFNVRTGAVEAFPAVVPVETYEVRIVDNEVQVGPARVQ